MTISFSEVPSTWRVKGVYGEIKPRYDRKGLYDWPAKAIVLGQMLATGSGQALTAYPITRVEQAIALFGAGSQAAQAVAAYKTADRTIELWAMGVADAAGTNAVKRITLTSTITAAGTLVVYVQGRRIAVGVSTADTVATVATVLAAAINANTSHGMTATAALGVVTLTAKHKGTLGNQIDVRANYWPDEATPAGLAVAVDAPTVGATDPSIAGALAATVNDWYTDWVMPWTDSANMVLLEADLARRYNAMTMQDAHAYTCVTGSYATVTTWSSTRNTQFVSTLPITGALEAPWEIAAALAGVAARHLTDDPSRQLGSLVLPGIKAPMSSLCYIDTEQNLMLNKGLSAWDTTADGKIVLNRVVTNYTKSVLNIDDDAWLDIMVPKTASRIRYDWRVHVGLTYPRHKLVDDGSPAADDPDNADSVVTPRRMKATWMARCLKYGDAVWIEDLEYTKAESHFERDPNDRNRLDGRNVYRIAGNLIVQAYSMEFAV